MPEWNKILLSSPPPDGIFGTAEIPIVHRTTELYKKIYQLSQHVPKKERLGLFAKIELRCLNALESGIAASLDHRTVKLTTLIQLRREIEVLKRLVRIGQELGLIKPKAYIEISGELQEISKMTNGWIKFLI